MTCRRLIAVAAAVGALALLPATASAHRFPHGAIPSPGSAFSIANDFTGGAPAAPDPATPAPGTPTGGGAPAPGGSTTPTGPNGGAAPGSVLPGKPPPPPVTDPPRQTRPGPGATDVPKSYLRLYRAAGKRYGVNWRLLAAIGKNETDHGRAKLPGVLSGLNSASCCSGPMQICTTQSCGRVWQAYAVDGDGDGRSSVFDPPDAIYGAAAIVRDLQKVFGRSHSNLLLAAYNAGPGAVQRAKGVPNYPETRSYVTRGLAYMRSLLPAKT